MTEPADIPPFLLGDADALCAETDPDAFYPEQGESTRAAKKICRRCELQDACLEWALENSERFGVWGGTSERERRAMSQPHASRKPINHGTAGGYLAHYRRLEPIPDDDSCGCRAAEARRVAGARRKGRGAA